MRTASICATAALVVCGAGVTRFARSQAEEAQGTLVGAPTCAADEVVSIEVAEQDRTIAFAAWTGRPGREHEADDLLAGRGAIRRLQERLAGAVATAEGNDGRAAVAVDARGALVVRSTNPGARITRVTRTNRTRQALASIALPPHEACTAYVLFAGGVQGTDDAGATASLTVGTARFTATRYADDGGTLAEIVARLAADLHREGIPASVDPDTGLALLLDLEPEDGALVFGGTDVAMQQSAGFVVRRAGEPAADAATDTEPAPRPVAMPVEFTGAPAIGLEGTGDALLRGFVQFQGGVAGITNGGAPATVTVGTARGTATARTEDFATVPELVRALAERLAAIGIDAHPDATGQALVLALDPQRDGGAIAAGCDDVALATTTSVAAR